MNVNFKESRKESSVDKNARRMDVFYVDLGTPIGNQQGGCRPCCIVQNNCGNLHSPTVIIIPISSQIQKMRQPTHTLLPKSDCRGLEKDSFTLAEQFRTINKFELGDYVGHIYNKETIEKIDKSMKISLGLFNEKSEIAQNKANYIKELDLFIAKWIDYHEDINKIKDEVNNRKIAEKDLACYCRNNNLNMSDYYNIDWIKNKRMVG